MVCARKSAFRVLCFALFFYAQVPTHAGRTECGSSVADFERALRVSLAGKEILKVEAARAGMSRRLFGTTIYYPAHAESLTIYPEIAKTSRAITLFLGGSGTNRSSGVSVLPTAQTLRRYSISMLSFDYPFHAGGPRDLRFRERRYFLRWIKRIVDYYKEIGLPVYLAGHSYGPGVIQELLLEYPNLVSGAYLFSPGGTNSLELLANYLNAQKKGILHANALKEGYEVDPIADRWADDLLLTFRSLALEHYPTQIPVWLAAGAKDEWNTPELIRAVAGRYKNHRLFIAPDTGHDIWNYRRPGDSDAFMVSAIVEMIEATSGQRFERLPLAEPLKIRLRELHENSFLFREFIRERAMPLSVYLRNEYACQGILSAWGASRDAYFQASARERYGENLPADLTSVVPKNAGTLAPEELRALIKYLAE